jgi:membrane protein
MPDGAAQREKIQGKGNTEERRVAVKFAVAGPESPPKSTVRRLAAYALLVGIRFARRRSKPTTVVTTSVSPPTLVTSPQPLALANETAPPVGQPVQGSGWWDLTKSAGLQWMEHKDARLGAALAYYSVFSIGPLIVIAIAVAGLLFGQDAVRGEVIGALKGLLGDTGAQAINAMLADASQPREGIVATIIGVSTLIFAAIGVVVQLKDALNTVWAVDTPPGTGIWGFMRAYVLSFAGVLALGFLLLISMLVTTALAAGGKYFAPYLPEAALQLISVVVSFGVISLLFAMMFKWLPDAKISWHDVWIGAIATAALFETGKFLIGLYIGKQGLESTYGAAASIVIVLIWVYYSAQIVLLGAEFTNVYARNRGSMKTRGNLRRKTRAVISRGGPPVAPAR